MPYPEEVHDPALTSVAIAWSQRNFIASKVLPPKIVSKSTDKYTTYTKADFTTLPDTFHGPRDGANEAAWGTSFSTYQCLDYDLKELVTDEERNEQSGSIDVEKDTVLHLTQLLMLDREQRVANAVFNTTTFSSYTSALGSTTRWDNYTSSSSVPLQNIEAAKESVLKNSLQPANTVIMGYEVFRYARLHPAILAAIKEAVGGEVKNVNERLLAQAFDVEQVLVGRAVYNSANRGQTESPSFVWGKSVMVAYIEPQMPTKGVTLGGTFRSRDFAVTRWRANDPPGTWIKAGMKDDEVIVHAGAGYLYTTVVS